MKNPNDQVRQLWRSLTDTPGAFAGQRLVTHTSDHHRAGPPGWSSIVTIGHETAAVGPAEAAGRFDEAIDDATREGGQIDPLQLLLSFAPERTLGPALLFYDLTSATAERIDQATSLADSRVRAVLDAVSDAERGESALDDASSAIFLASAADGAPAAICGWSGWPHGIAHIGVLTHPDHRRDGHGTTASRAAIRAAKVLGLIPQWRAAANNASSIALARSLGLTELGWQFSVDL